MDWSPAGHGIAAPAKPLVSPGWSLRIRTRTIRRTRVWFMLFWRSWRHGPKGAVERIEEERQFLTRAVQQNASRLLISFRRSLLGGS